ncbi:MAG: DUF1700 domain-containing protein [Lachnospiraceae bacterium]|nr:DUF1700 domain-containing protein [Lachnospiraceae bacterium]
MNKVEFTDMLRRHISEVGDPVFVNDTVEYYQNYIENAIRKGASEADVLAELGDPRLIAKSIVASRDVTEDYSEEERIYREQSGSYSEENDAGYSGVGSDGKLHIRLKSGRDIAIPYKVAKWTAAGVGLMLFIGVGYVTWQLMPVIGVGILAFLIYRFVRDNF